MLSAEWPNELYRGSSNCIKRHQSDARKQGYATTKEKKSRSLNTQTKIKMRYVAPTLISEFLQFYLFTTDGYIQRYESRQRIASQQFRAALTRRLISVQCKQSLEHL
jgi:hypothetical protein